MIAEWQEQHKQLIEDLDNSKERINELEKENADLKADIELLKNGETLKELQTEVFKLTKENAELKEKQKWLGSSTKCWFTNSPCRSCDEHDERLKRLGLCYIGQLTKAKNIIKDLLFFLKKFYSEDCPVCMDEAEQFLKE